MKNKYIALLRGINVGGKRKILMKDLKSLLAEIGFEDVVTYIQSGNVVFNSNENPSTAESQIKKIISLNYDFEVPVIVISVSELKNIVENNPFLAENEIEKLHVTLLSDIPELKNIEIAEKSAIEYSDKYELLGKNVFICCEGKYHKSKLSNNFFEKKMKVNATTRNWKTISKLWELRSK